MVADDFARQGITDAATTTVSRDARLLLGSSDVG
jgi:hypothetical protein